MPCWNISHKIFIQRKKMIRTVIIGAAGRMGRMLVANVAKNANFELAGATEYAGSPDIGKDAGVLAGVGELGVKITSDLNAILETRPDAVINFATAGVMDATKASVAAGAAVVIGSTLITAEDKAEFKRMADAGAKLVVAGNYSIGVNLLFKLVRESTEVLGLDADVEIVEMHHNLKKDAPSGTAARLAEVVCEARDWSYEEDLRHGRVGVVGERTKHEIGMHSLRGGDVVGDHTVMFALEGERVELTHKASSRNTFARGALRAAEFLVSAEAGLYDMQDVLGLK